MGETVQTQRRIAFTPRFMDCSVCSEFFRKTANSLVTDNETSGAVEPSAIKKTREKALANARQNLDTHYQQVRLAISLLADLVLQGWNVRVEDESVYLEQPRAAINRDEEKERVRRTLQIAREEQLSETSVQNFLRSMTTQRLWNRQWYSIYSLMRDGKELEAELQRIREQQDKNHRAEMLTEVIQPYLQFVTEGSRCEWTGFRLADIWRYFRYTWLNPARSTPGRMMMILIRDAAVEPHPVIGIAALTSSIVAQQERDEWIGWDQKGVYRRVKSHPSDEMAGWLLTSLEQLLSDIHVQDFLQDGILSAADLTSPGGGLLSSLRELSVQERRRHQQQIRKTAYKQKQAADNWESLVGSHLYRSKRALALAELLDVRYTFNQAGLTEPSGEHLALALQSPGLRQAIFRLVRRVKALHVGINMMDISVAGAIAPYNALLGGKLVSLLLAGPEVTAEYERRYGNSASVIASAMKGEAIIRVPNLVLLCTTGLFGGGSSQYNRIRLPASAADGEGGEIRYVSLGGVTSYSTFHISQATMEEMRIYSEQHHEGSDVHGIFGEGVNPKMRKIREALAQVGLPNDVLLQTSSPRMVYVVPLAHNFREVLLGQQTQPRYILPLGDCGARAATQKMVRYWRRRWLADRILSEQVLEDVRRHTISFPVLHGGIVEFPHPEETINVLLDFGDDLDQGELSTAGDA